MPASSKRALFALFFTLASLWLLASRAFAGNDDEFALGNRASLMAGAVTAEVRDLSNGYRIGCALGQPVARLSHAAFREPVRALDVVHHRELVTPNFATVHELTLYVGSSVWF
jgi:hypothetical protein